jgi:hypothetical protein
MRRICAWCGQEMSRLDFSSDLTVTHGLCTECRKRFFVSTDSELPTCACGKGSDEEAHHLPFDQQSLTHTQEDSRCP